MAREPVSAEVARARKEKRNLSRRKCYVNQTEESGRQGSVAQAQQKYAEIIESGKKEAARILEEARTEAKKLVEASNRECDLIKKQREQLRLTLGREAVRLQAMQRQGDNGNSGTSSHSNAFLFEANDTQAAASRGSDPEDMEVDPAANAAAKAAAEAVAKEAADAFRKRDAERKRAAYFEKRNGLLDSNPLSSWPKRKPKRGAQLDSTAGDGEHASDSNRGCRSVQRTVNLLVADALERLSRFNDRAKSVCFKRFWLHPSLKQYQPVKFGNPQADVSIAAAVSDLKRTLQIVKTARRKDYLSTKQVLCTALTGESVVTNRYQSSLAKTIGVQRQNLHRAAKKRKMIDEDVLVKYPMGERKTRSDKISEVVKTIVQKFWESNTRISPCKKDNARLRLSRKVFEEHRIHWLEDTEVQFFLKFKEWCSREDNGVDIGLRMFQYMKPYYIRTMKDRNVCCCKAHVEMDLLKEAINKFRKHEHPQDCTCNCQVCKVDDGSPVQRCVASKLHLITSVSSWTESVLCPKKLGKQWHKKKCIMGHCKKCGVEKNLKWCTTELDPNERQFVDWQTFEYVELDEKTQQKRERKKGTAESATKKVKRQRIVHKRTSMLVFRRNVVNTMADFLVHNFRAKWQSEQFRFCLKSFPRGTIVSSIDFSENYSFKMQNEIQSLHWDNQQITLLIHVVYRHRQDSEGDVDTAVGRRVKMAVVDGNCERDIIADYNFYVSDDNTHDTLFVQHCMDAHHQSLKSQGVQFDQHWVWSDGAASQFKSCRPFYYVSRHYKTHGARMKWFFHASGHGKGVADALGGHIKQGLEKEQLRGLDGHRLENAHDAVEFCREKFAMGQQKEYGDVQLVRRVFWEIPVGAVNRRKKWDCDTIKGSRTLHCFDGFSPRLSTLLQVRELCCFCHNCLDDEPGQCENIKWTGEFQLQVVRGVLPSDVRSDVEEMGVGEGLTVLEDGSLAEMIQLGDFFAVKAEIGNSFDVEFYILQCVQPLHTVKKAFTDDFGESFQEWDEALKGLWYQQVPGNELKYVLVDNVDKCFSHAASVVHIRFALTPCVVGKGKSGGARMYTLDEDTLDAITDSLGY